MLKCAFLVSLCLSVVSCSFSITHVNIENLQITSNSERTNKTDVYYNCTSPTGKDYIVHKEEVNFFRALQVCENNGMELATVLNDAEHEMMSLIVKQNLSSGKYVWLSGVKSELNGDYTWLKNFKRMSYTKWTANQPAKNDQALCMCVMHDNQWTIAYCYGKHIFACQRSCQRPSPAAK